MSRPYGKYYLNRHLRHCGPVKKSSKTIVWKKQKNSKARLFGFTYQRVLTTGDADATVVVHVHRAVLKSR